MARKTVSSKYAHKAEKLANGKYRVFMPSRNATIDVANFYQALSLESAERVLADRNEDPVSPGRSGRGR